VGGVKACAANARSNSCPRIRTSVLGYASHVSPSGVCTTPLMRVLSAARSGRIVCICPPRYRVSPNTPAANTSPLGAPYSVSTCVSPASKSSGVTRRPSPSIQASCRSNCTIRVPRASRSIVVGRGGPASTGADASVPTRPNG
jgi:hypothetical protein